MPSPVTAAAGLWALWLLSWLLAARWSSRPVARQPARERLIHIGLLCAGAALVIGHPRRLAWLGTRLIAERPWVGWGALALVVIGFAFAWWARLHLGRLWSGNVTLKADHAVVQSGPYRITRHPIYTGLLLSLAATVTLQDDLAALVGLALVVAGLLIKIRQEERLLTAHLGTAYETYRARVPALIPDLW